MFMRVSSTLVALALVGLVTGCGKAPVDQFEAGKAALENARLAEADQYAPELFKEATDSLNAAAVEIEKQDGRFATFRSYGKAEQTITAAQQLVQQAIDQAAVEKENVRVADSALVVEIEALIADTKAALKAAPRGKGSSVDLKVMQADIDAAVAALAVATEDYNAGSYLTANQKLQAVKLQVLKVKGDIDAAVAKLKK